MIKYELIYSDRKTLSMQLKGDGTLAVKAPEGTPRAEIEKFILSHTDWIEKNKQKIHDMPRPPRLTEKEIKDLADSAVDYFGRTVPYYAALMGVTYGNITIRNQKTKWGSCTADGNLNFNCLLMLADEKIRDYVIVHELAHRREMNHSKKFWAQVEKICPDYKQLRDRLNKEGRVYMYRMFGDEK